MSAYKFRDPDGLYFVALTVVEWVDVITRRMKKMRICVSIICLSTCFSVFSQHNIFGHYESPSVSKHLLHLRPDSTYVLYYISDIGPFPRPEYEDIEPKPYAYKQGIIYLLDENTGFDSSFVLTDSLHLKSKNSPNALFKKVFYHNDGTIKYVVEGKSWHGYKLNYYEDNCIILSLSFNLDDTLHGSFVEYYPISQPFESENYEILMRDKDPLNWNLLIGVMDMNSLIKTKGYWLNGRKDGWWTHFKEDGTISKKEKWKDGNLKKSRKM